MMDHLLIWYGQIQINNKTDLYIQLEEQDTCLEYKLLKNFVFEIICNEFLDHISYECKVFWKCLIKNSLQFGVRQIIVTDLKI